MEITPKKIVCIFAHPDDEAFGPGGSIAYFSKAGVEVCLISVTSGDAASQFTDGINSGAKLGKIRREELLKSAKILGVNKVFFLKYNDGSLCNNNYHNILKDVKKIIDDLHPDTIMTFYLDGVSGHIDHMAVSAVSSFLFERVKYVKNILYFCNGTNEKKYFGRDYFIYFPEGHPKEDVDLVINTKKYFSIKKASMLAHKSQEEDAHMLLKYMEKFPKEEYFKIRTKK